MTQNKEYLSGPLAFMLMGHLMPLINLVVILVLSYYTFVDWGVKEEARSKIMIWLATISGTVVVQSFAGIISSAYLEGNTIVITTRWRRYRIPADAVIGVNPCDLGINGVQFIRIQFSDECPIKDAIISVEFDVTNEMIIERILRATNDIIEQE